jgi:hypothetical protein
MRLLPLAIVAMSILAGCAGSRPGGDTDPTQVLKPVIPDDWAEHAVPSGEGHDHFNSAHHQNLSTANFDLLGWNPLISESYGITPGYHLCGDATDTGERRFAAVQGGGDVAFILVDVTDGADPKVIGELLMPTVSARDIALTPDGKYVVVGTSGAKQPERGPVPPLETQPQVIWRSPCNSQDLVLAGPEQNLPLANGVVLVSIQTPATPEIMSYFPLPALGAHSIYAQKIASQYYVLASVTNLATATTYFDLFDIVETEDRAALVHVSYILEQPQQGNAPLINGHNDGVIVPHPINNRVYGWFALWHQGLAIVDLSNPRVPMVVGRWTDNPPGNTAVGTNDYGDVHEALPLNETWDGKHYTFIGQEILGRPSYAPSGYMKVLDTTDPANPKAVTQWNLPTEVEWNASLQFSTHYISRHNQTVFMSHYHAGVWAIDVSDLTIPQLPAIGVFVPANVSPKPPPTVRSYDWTPTVMENNALPNGDIVVWDSSSGVYVVHFDETNKAPPAIWEGN